MSGGEVITSIVNDANNTYSLGTVNTFNITATDVGGVGDVILIDNLSFAITDATWTR